MRGERRQVNHETKEQKLNLEHPSEREKVTTRSTEPICDTNREEKAVERKKNSIRKEKERKKRLKRQRERRRLVKNCY